MASVHPVGHTKRVTPGTDDNLELFTRVGRAWREIRRGAAANEIKGLFYGAEGDPDALDMALADALSVIVQQGPLRMGELAEALHITPASTTRAVSCLVGRGYANREKSVDDQRSYVVSATQEGERVQALFGQRIHDGLTQIMSRFSPDEHELLAEFLERFARSVDTYVADSGGVPPEAIDEDHQQDLPKI